MKCGGVALLGGRHDAAAVPPLYCLVNLPRCTTPHHHMYCRYGEFVVLDQHDHISVCKPHDPSDPAYARLMAFLHARVRALKRERADAAAASMDHMEAAAM